MLTRLRRAATGILATIGFLFVFVTVTPVVSLWARKLAGVWTDPKGETLIVLGGSMLDNGVIGLNSYWRAVYAARAYHSDGFRRVVVSGGGSNRVSEAIREFLICQGVPASAITTETESLDTHQNALRTASLLRGDTSRKVLLTSDYHMYRASRAFALAGVTAAPRPFPDAIKMAEHWEWRWSAFLQLCIESSKIAYYRTRGWM